MSDALLRFTTCLLTVAIFAFLGCERDKSNTDTEQAANQSQVAPSENGASGSSSPVSSDGKSSDSDLGARESASRAAKAENAQPKKHAMRPARKGDVRPEAAWPPETSGEYPVNAYRNYIETGDLDAIKKDGKLRILVDIANVDSLHRAATQQDIELEQAKRMAKHLGLEPVVLYANNFEQLIPLLNEGKGDIIANNMVVSDSRKQRVDFSIPTANTQLILVSRKDAKPVTKVADLKGKSLVITKGTAYEELAEKYAATHPGLKFKASKKNYVELLIDVAEGRLDFTVVEQQVYELVSQFKDNLKKNHVFPEEQKMAWAMRKNSPELQAAINDYIRHAKLTSSTQRSVDDLDAIKERGVIRVVTRNHPASYYMWKGRIMGYEYELAQDFAKYLDLRLEIIVAPAHVELINMLLEGKADVAASLLSATERRKKAGLAFGPGYIKEKVVIVGRDDEDLKSIKDLAGRKVYVRKSASHYDVALRIKKQVPEMEIVLAPEELNIQQIIDKVADDEYDLAIADDLSVRLERTWRNNIDSKLDLHEENNVYGWMVRASNPKLLEAVANFKNKKSTQKKQRILYTKYFESPKQTRKEINTVNKKGEISPFDDIVKKYADEHNFDWRLVVAQMFQESTFNPKAKSWVGARGLMQVMPDTGKQVGEKNLFDPETSVRAGLKYLNWLHRKFEDKGISSENKMWFTLASYNAGLGHVYDAQDLAEEKGWDRRVWFDNVEKAMLLLSQKKYYSKARYGFARGQEPFDYVRKIKARFRTYVALLDDYQRRNQQGSLLPIPELRRLFATAFYLPLYRTPRLAGATPEMKEPAI